VEEKWKSFDGRATSGPRKKTQRAWSSCGPREWFNIWAEDGLVAHRIYNASVVSSLFSVHCSAYIINMATHKVTD
jgi:hypothetical protein